MIQRILQFISKLFFFFQKKKEFSINQLEENKEKVVQPLMPSNFNQNKNNWNPPFWYKSYLIKPYTYLRFKRSFVTSDGIVFNGKELVKESLVYPHFEQRFGKNYLCQKIKSCKLIKKKKLILIWNHWGKTNYYHWMIDSLSNLVMLDSKQFDGYKLLISSEAPLFVFESLKCFDIEIEKIKMNQLINCKDLIYPIYPTSSGKVDDILISKIRFNFFKHSEKLNIKYIPNLKKIYVSRSKQKIRKIENEFLLFDLLQKNGYSIVYFEDYSFWEQVQLMKNATHLIAPHGANLVNMLVMQENAKIIEMNQKDLQSATLCYWTLANSLNFEYNYVPIELIDQSFILDSESIERISQVIN